MLKTESQIKSAPFNEGRTIGRTEKGKRGFQRKPDKAEVIIRAVITRGQAMAIKTFCKENNISISELIRAGVNCYIQSSGGKTSADINQLSIFD